VDVELDVRPSVEIKRTFLKKNIDNRRARTQENGCFSLSVLLLVSKVKSMKYMQKRREKLY